MAARTYRAQKMGLTRAINKRDPVAVLVEVRRTVNEWHDSGQPWPDDWHRWNIAWADALNDLRAIWDITRLI